jgi:endonuclease-3
VSRRSGPRETADRAVEILDRLEDAYPDARVELAFGGPLQLLVATILSAQSTDKRVNEVTPALFRAYPDAAAFANAAVDELEEAIRSTGFFRQKARHIQQACRKIVAEHDGTVPADMAALTALPGVGRKTANVVRAAAFGLPGIAVDTHCKRVSNRLGLVADEDPVRIEQRLGELVPEARWIDVSRLFIWHGRYVCKARRPLCARCSLPDLCPWFQEHGDA